MKIILLLSGILSLPSFAAETPPDPCNGMGCTPRMEAIAAGFRAGAGITEGELPLLASGECYHLTRDYDPNTTHYGIVLLDPHEGAVYMGGAFGFFYPENPYKDWTVERARKENSNLYASNHRVELAPSFAFSDMNPGKTPIWYYWIRRIENRLYVMGHWGVEHRLLCELDLQ